MPNLGTDFEATPRRELHVFYVLDTSGSMASDGKISMLNRAMEECTTALATIAKSNADAMLKIAVLEFNSGCKWITNNGPESLDDFEWDTLEAGGITDMGAALLELNSKLSRNAFLNSMTGAYMPVIIFMTDGYATDNYEASLQKIRQNKWFARGTKIGFAVGDDADLKMISSVVGNSEAVIKTTDLELFKRLMTFVTVTASTLASTSHTTDVAADGAAVVGEAKKEISGVVTGDLADTSYDREPDPAPDAGSGDVWDDDGW